MVAYIAFSAVGDSASWLSIAEQAYIDVINWWWVLYARAPALVFGVTVAAVLPLVALVGAVVNLGGSQPASRRSSSRPDYAVENPTWRKQFMFEFQGVQHSPFVIRQELVRIGHGADNDLRLEHPSVDHYHAVLERTPESGFVLMFVGDPNEAGIVVDGQNKIRHELLGGEVVRIGDVELRFVLAALDTSRTTRSIV